MKVAQSAVVSLLIELDMVTADKWPLDRVEKKVAQLPKLVDQEELEAETKEGKKLLASILKAIKDDEEIKISAKDTTEKSSKSEKPAKSTKPAKKAKDEDEDSDDDDEEGEDEESDDEDSDDDSSDDEESDEEDGEGDSEDDDDEEESDDSDSDDDEEEEEKPAKKKKGKGSPIKSAGGEGKPGIIATILECLMDASEDKPISKKGILKVLTKRFPDREADSMARTINVQVPNRIKNDRGLEVGKNDNGYFIVKSKKSKK